MISKVIDDAKKVPSVDETDSSRWNRLFNVTITRIFQFIKGSNLLKSIKRFLSKLLPEHTKLEITFTGKNLIQVSQ